MRATGLWVCLALLAGCAAADSGDGIEAHEEASDLAPFEGAVGKADGLPERFDRNWVMSDDYYTESEAYDGDSLQSFLEDTPYKKRSWLADESVAGQRASDLLATASRRYGINPVVLLARMQVERSLVGKSVRPKQSLIDHAFGCGCYDAKRCLESTSGLAKQIDCAARALRDNFDKSTTASGLWTAGVAKKTLDPIWVTPANHATAALYAYTPWVLERRGGNWLVWNVTRRFQARFDQMEPAGAVTDGCLNDGRRPFIGDPCGCEADCGFSTIMGDGWCDAAGFCTVACEGFCPDLPGRASTFCVADPRVVNAGICVSKSADVNDHCATLPRTEVRTTSRFIGSSNAAARDADVCLP